MRNLIFQGKLSTYISRVSKSKCEKYETPQSKTIQSISEKSTYEADSISRSSARLTSYAKGLSKGDMICALSQVLKTHQAHTGVSRFNSERKVQRTYSATQRDHSG